MRKSLNTSKWYENAWAAFIFFTRVPFYQLYEPPADSYKAVVEFWPLTGWFTGSLMAVTLYFSSMVLPYPIAIMLAIAVRLLLTGALHEDGLADFCDGFGGGRDRRHILEIMKDSHIGTFGVLGLLVYGMLLFLSLMHLPCEVAATAIFFADPYSKMLSSQIVQMLPYARSEQEAKSRTVYRKISVPAAIGLSVQGLLPAVLFFYLYPQLLSHLGIIIFIPCLLMYLLYRLMQSRIKGYTGDCCGALFLLTELSTYLSIVAIWR